MMLKSRKAVSPVLAVIVLLGITVVAGGLVFSAFSQASSTSMESNVISVKDASIHATNGHGSFSMTMKNEGTKSWKSVSINGYMSETPALIFYRPLSWNAAGGTWGPSDPVSPSNVIDLAPTSSDSLTVIGIGNLISYETDNPVFWGPAPFGLKLWPTQTDFCNQSYGKVSFADVGGNCNDGFQSYIGKILDEPISPGDTLAPASFVLTRQLTNSTGGEALPHHFVQKGDTVVISIIVEAIDGSTAQKDFQVTAT